MKLFLALAFLAAASAVDIQPVVLPEIPQPQVNEAPEIQDVQSDIYRVKIADGPVERNSVRIADAPVDQIDAVQFSDLPNEAAVDGIEVVGFQMPDISPVFVSEDVVKQSNLEAPEATFEGTAEISPVKIAEAPLEVSMDDQVDAVRVIDGPVNPSAGAVDAVRIVEVAQNEIPDEYLRDYIQYVMPREYLRGDLPVPREVYSRDAPAPVYADAMLR